MAHMNYAAPQMAPLDHLSADFVAYINLYAAMIEQAIKDHEYLRRTGIDNAPGCSLWESKKFVMDVGEAITRKADVEAVFNNIDARYCKKERYKMK